MTDLNEFLKIVGATDLVDAARHFNNSSAGDGRFQTPSDRNKSVALVAQDGKLSILFGLGDRNFAPVSVDFDDTGKANQISIPNTNMGRSGQTNFRADERIIDAVARAATSMKSGNNESTGLYAAQLAKAAGAPSSWGQANWGTRMTDPNIDTATLNGSINAMSAVVAKWQPHIV